MLRLLLMLFIIHIYMYANIEICKCIHVDMHKCINI